MTEVKEFGLTRLGSQKDWLSPFCEVYFEPHGFLWSRDGGG